MEMYLGSTSKIAFTLSFFFVMLIHSCFVRKYFGIMSTRLLYPTFQLNIYDGTLVAWGGVITMTIFSFERVGGVLFALLLLAMFVNIVLMRWLFGVRSIKGVRSTFRVINYSISLALWGAACAYAGVLVFMPWS
ncbi:MAG TPA: hypothetical protein VJJ02_04155 [Candidatus Paceibacterota bacterium]